MLRLAQEESQVQSQTFRRNKHPDIVFWFWAVGMGWEFRDYLFFTFGIKNPHSCLSTWLKQPSTEVSSIVNCYVMLTANWSWRGNLLCFLNVTLLRCEGDRKKRNRVSAGFIERMTWIQTHTLSGAVTCQITAKVLYVIQLFGGRINMTNTYLMRSRDTNVHGWGMFCYI